MISAIDILAQFVSYANGWGRVNQGVSFGLGQGVFSNLLFVGVLLLLGLLYFSGRLKERGWSFILLGGGVNTAGRVFLGGVYDYLHWPYYFDLWFNLSDVVIAAGVIMVLFQIFYGKRTA